MNKPSEQDFVDIGDGVQLMKGRLKENGNDVVVSRYLAMIYPLKCGCRMATAEDLWKGYVKSEEVRKSLDGVGMEWTADVLVNRGTLVHPEAARVSMGARGKHLTYLKIPELISLDFIVPEDAGYATQVGAGFPTEVVRVFKRKKVDGQFYFWWGSYGDGIKTITAGKPYDSPVMDECFVVSAKERIGEYELELPFRLAKDSRLDFPEIRKADEPKGE